MIRILAYGLLLIIAVAAPNASAVVAEKTQPKHIATEKKEKSSSTETLAKENTETASKISASAQAYKDNPSNETYIALWQDFENWIRQLNAKHIDASSSCKSCSALDKAGLKIIDAAGSGATIKIYTFSPQAICSQNKPAPDKQNGAKSELKPLISSTPRTNIESRNLLIQSTELVASEPSTGSEKHRLRKKHRCLRVHKAAVVRTQSISIPPNTEIKQACLLIGSVSKGHFLAILGVDLQSGRSWAEGLKATSTGWAPDSTIWQQVPTFLLQEGQAKVKLSENNLVITIGSHTNADGNTGGGYELVMPFVENHFALTRNEAQDPAKAVALQFLLAVQGKRQDLVKIWLADPELASIPGYLGLYNNHSDNNHSGNPAALKLINMSPPLNGGVRFRLITNTKDDLIIDVGRVKAQWLIKALFIAPADSLAREIGRVLPPEQSN